MKYLMIVFNLMLLGSVTVVSAQSQVYGTLQDKDQQPIDFGEVRLTLKEADNPIQTYSDTLGYFKFDDVPHGLYNLQILHWGNLQEERELTIDKNIDMGILSINSSAQLSEIVIAGKKKLFETKIDRNVFNVKNSIAASSGDALDAIKATPGIAVSNDDIKIVGKNSVSVMINDRPVQLSGEDLNNYLKTLSASDIQKIEVITTPPAKYEAQGNAGIINIVLKPQRENAWNNSSRFNYVQASYANFKFGDTFTYSKDRLNIQAGIDLSAGNHGRTERMSNYYPDETWISVDPDKTDSKSFSAKLALDYQLTAQSNLGFQYMRNSYQDNSIWNHAKTSIYDSNQTLSSEIFTNALTDMKNHFDNINFNYDYKIDTLGKKMTLNLDYFTSSKANNRPFESQRFYESSLLAPQLVKASSSGNVDVEIYSAKIDFEHPLKSFKLDYGAKVNWIKNSSNSKYFDRISGNPILDPSRSDQFDYQEQGQAVYISANKEWSPKWTTQLGLRMEATQTTGMSQSLKQEDKKSFLDLFPTVYLQYQASENHNLSLNYNKRVIRPSFWSLNPFKWYIDAYSYAQGNPFLEPFYTNKIELSYTYKKNWNIRIDYSKTKNGITQIQNIDENEKTRIFTQENFYNLEGYSLSQNYTFSKYPWWQSVNSLTVSYYKSDFNNNDKQIYIPQNGLGAYFSSQNSFKIDSQLSLEVNGNISSKSKFTMYKIDPNASLNLGLSYKMMDDNLRMTFNIVDVFRTSASKVYTYTQDTQIVYNNYYDNRYANLGITYNFGNKNIKTNKKQTGNEEERNRL